MASIGNYVHYLWTNYAHAGTYKTRRYWNLREGKNSFDSNNNYTGPGNFNLNIFQQHLADTKAAINTLSRGNIEQLEFQYNNANQTIGDALRELVNRYNTYHNSADQKILEEILVGINQNWNSPLVLQTLLQNLRYDSDGFLAYTGIATQNASNSFSIQKYRPLSITGAGYNLKSLISHITNLQTNVQSTCNNPVTKTFLLSYLNNLKIICTQTGAAATNAQNALSKINSGLAFQTLNPAMIQKGQGRLTEAEGRPIAQAINDVGFAYESIASVNNTIKSRLAEMSATAFPQLINKSAMGALRDVANNVNSMMGTQTSNRIDFDLFFKDFDLGALKDKTITQATSRSTYSIRSWFGEVGQDRMQKADVNFQGQYTSIKTADLSKTGNMITKVNEQIFTQPRAINLQTSSLLLYLMGIEYNSRSGDNYGNHYLNIFANHVDTKGPYSQMRNAANRALQLYLAYSAATGSGQMRSQNLASIIAIQDTRTSAYLPRPKIYLFNIRDLLQTGLVGNITSMFTFSPIIESINLNNAWVGTQKRFSMKDSNTRISKLLIDARSKRIAVGLRHDAIKKLRGIR